MIKELNKKVIVFTFSPWLDSIFRSAIFNVFNNLAKLGYQVKVIVPSTSNKFIKNGSFSVLGIKVKKLGSPIILLSPSICNSYLKFLFENRQSTLIFNHWMLPLFLLAKLLYKSKGILLIRSRPIGQKGFKIWLFSLFFRMSLILGKSFVDMFTAISPLEAVEFCRMAKIPKEKMIVVPSPLGEHFKKNSPIDKDQLWLKLGLDVLLRKKVLLYHGVLSELRDILKVVEVFANSFKGNNDIALLLVGDGPAKSSVKNFIQTNDIQNIILYGSVSYSKMPEIIAASDIGLVLLPDYPWWRYQCPIKLLELLVIGKPIIASDLSGIRWVADNSTSVIYLKNLNVPSFKEAVKKALTMKNIKGSQKIVDRFSSSSIALKLSQIISNGCTLND